MLYSLPGRGLPLRLIKYSTVSITARPTISPSPPPKTLIRKASIHLHYAHKLQYAYVVRKGFFSMCNFLKQCMYSVIFPFSRFSKSENGCFCRLSQVKMFFFFNTSVMAQNIIDATPILYSTCIFEIFNSVGPFFMKHDFHAQFHLLIVEIAVLLSFFIGLFERTVRKKM